MDQDLHISSPAFEDGGDIPSQYTSDGEGISPPLNISGVGDEVKALVLIVDDPDAATDPDGPGKTFDHWVLFNIAPSTLEIAEGSVPTGAIEGQNGSGQNNYIGPAPPNGRHNYFFKLYALNEPLSLDSGASKQDVENALRTKVVAQAEL